MDDREFDELVARALRDAPYRPDLHAAQREFARRLAQESERTATDVAAADGDLVAWRRARQTRSTPGWLPAVLVAAAVAACALVIPSFLQDDSLRISDDIAARGDVPAAADVPLSGDPNDVPLTVGTGAPSPATTRPPRIAAPAPDAQPSKLPQTSTTSKAAPQAPPQAPAAKAPAAPAPKPPAAPAPKPPAAPAPKPPPQPVPTTAASRTAAQEAAQPYTSEAVCGNGFRVINRHALSRSVIYLLWNAQTKRNCVVTLKTKNVGTPTPTRAYLEPDGAAAVEDSGRFRYYANVTVDAPGCIRWGGADDLGEWLSEPGVHCQS